MGNIVELHPDAQKRPYLHGGQYGPGLQHSAECEVVEYDFPAKEPPRYAPNDPAENYAFLQIRVRSDEFGMNTIFHYEPITANSGSKLGTWLTAMGVPVEGETFMHDTDQVVGLKVCVTVGDARVDKNDPEPDPEKKRHFTGRMTDIFAA